MTNALMEIQSRLLQGKGITVIRPSVFVKGCFFCNVNMEQTSVSLTGGDDSKVKFIFFSIVIVRNAIHHCNYMHFQAMAPWFLRMFWELMKFVSQRDSKKI